MILAVLLAVIVLISTMFSLQNKALFTGNMAVDDVGTMLSVSEAYGKNDKRINTNVITITKPETVVNETQDS